MTASHWDRNALNPFRVVFQPCAISFCYLEFNMLKTVFIQIWNRNIFSDAMAKNGYANYLHHQIRNSQENLAHDRAFITSAENFSDETQASPVFIPFLIKPPFDMIKSFMIFHDIWNLYYLHIKICVQEIRINEEEIWDNLPTRCRLTF